MDERRAFGESEARYRREYTVFHDFLAAFYNMQAPKDTCFRQARKVSGGQAGALASFVNLVGGLASGDRAFTDAEQLTGRRGTASRVLDESVHSYQGSPAGDPWNESPVPGETFAQSGLLAEQGTAVHGSFAEQTPQFPDGLVATADGLCWTEPGRGTRTPRPGDIP